MEMGFDHDAWPLSQAPGADTDADPKGGQGQLDWHGLRARFLAARACRKAFGNDEFRSNKIVDASFDRSAALALADFEDASQSINLDSSADGKAPFGIGEGIAGASMCGDRG